jgi:hypothetical protein
MQGNWRVGQVSQQVEVSQVFVFFFFCVFVFFVFFVRTFERPLRISRLVVSRYCLVQCISLQTNNLKLNQEHGQPSNSNCTHVPARSSKIKESSRERDEMREHFVLENRNRKEKKAESERRP